LKSRNQKPVFYDLSWDDLTNFLLSKGEAKYRKDQIWEGVYQHLWDKPEHFFTIPNELQGLLTDAFDFTSLTPIRSLTSSDKHTRKILFRTRDGNYIETVLMQYQDRNTLCISSQSGCPVGCSFCSTGQMGFIANISRGEIIEQVMYFSRLLKTSSQKLSNIVLMGMGEPFLNYENSLGAIDILNDSKGYRMSERRFTISTVGIIPGIVRFTGEKRQVNLAVSLHAPNDSLRSKLIPINKKYPIADLLSACREYVNFTGRRITFEYALIDGVNDSLDLSRELVSKVKGILCHVNLIQLNSSPSYQHKGSDSLRARSFLNIIQESGIPATMRLRMGLDIQAGCGQLAYQNIPETR
jgi:23S rRNA (adenine2503-C2)-methyltransferase